MLPSPGARPETYEGCGGSAIFPPMASAVALAQLYSNWFPVEALVSPCPLPLGEGTEFELLSSVGKQVPVALVVPPSPWSIRKCRASGPVCMVVPS